MEAEDLNIKLNELYKFKNEFQKMIRSKNSDYIKDISSALKETNIDKFIETSKKINKSQNDIEIIIKSALTDIDKEIESLESKLIKPAHNRT